jgi:hypothetical protein
MEYLSIDETIILEWILKEKNGRPKSGSCEYGKKSSGSINGGEYLK